MIRLDESLMRTAREACAPVSTDSIPKWARSNIILGPAYRDTGPFVVENSRYLIEPFNAIKDFKIRIVACAAAVQTGKSLLADISIPWFVVNRPGPIQFSQATDPMVQDHVKNRLYPLMANCKPLKNILPPSDKDLTNTGIRFANGCTLYCNGSKETAFQAKSVQLAICDEVWEWDRGRLPQAIARVTAFDQKGTSKILIVSMPGELDDDFDKAYRVGTMEEWCVPCLGCGDYFHPIWREQHNDGKYYGMLWDTNDSTCPSGSYNMPELVKTIRYECKECGHKHLWSNTLKEEWNKRGKYIATNPSATNSVRSFKWNSIPLRSWDLLVEEFLTAKELSDKGIHANLTRFFQQRIAKPFDPKVTQFVGHIKTDVYDTHLEWPEEVARFATIDVQKYHFWMELRAWSAVADSKQLFYGQVVSEDEIRKLIETYKINVNSVFVDIGNTEKQEDTGRHLVYEFVDRNGFTGLRGDHWGSDKGGYDWIVRGQTVKLYYSKPQFIPNSKNNRHYYNFAPDNCRDLLKELRDDPTGKKFKCLDNGDFKRQMFAEKKMPVRDKYNQITWRWKNPHNMPNHAWDCCVMQVVATLLHPGIHLIPKI